MSTSLKSILLHFLLGIGIVLIVGSLLLLVSLDMRWMAAEAIVLSSVVSFYFSKEQHKALPLLNSLILTIPFAVFFWLVISNDLPSLWFLIVLFFVSSYIGSSIKFAKKKELKIVGVNLILIVASIVTVPLFVGDDLTKFVKQEAGSFELLDHEGNSISSEQLKGKVVILDFYGTWCKPCIAELPELAKVRDHFVDNPDIAFFVVNADQGGDNLDKAKKFEQRFDLGFTYIYDEGQKVYKRLGLTSAGVPSIVIIDGQGFIRLKHIGYNKSETNFVEQMVENIQRIASSK